MRALTERFFALPLFCHLATYLGLVLQLLSRLSAYNATAVPAIYPPPSKFCDPNLYPGKHFLAWGEVPDYLSASTTELSTSSSSTVELSSSSSPSLGDNGTYSSSSDGSSMAVVEMKDGMKMIKGMVNGSEEVGPHKVAFGKQQVMSDEFGS